MKSIKTYSTNSLNFNGELMSYTNNELALLDLIGNVNKIFYYIGEDVDLVDPSDVKQLDKAVASFKQSIQLGDHNAQDVEYI
tara:strand:+ start:284 stop:529 length:246 start_codon:yes stop_codon:yes gene_type:complete